MPTFIFGERKRFPHHPPDPLAQGIVPPLHVRGLAGVLADALVALFGKDAGVGLPEVAEGAATPVGLGYPAPKHPAGRLAPVTIGISHYLPRPAAQRRPRPHLVGPLPYVAADLVQLKHVTGPCGREAVRHLRQPPAFFLATRPRWGATPRTCARCPAGWTVPGTPAGFLPCAPGRTGRSVPAPGGRHNPCSGIAACRLRCARS